METTAVAVYSTVLEQTFLQVYVWKAEPTGLDFYQRKQTKRNPKMISLQHKCFS